MLAQIPLCLLPHTGQSTETWGTSWHRPQLFPASYQTGVGSSGGVTRYFLAHQPKQITVHTHTYTHTLKPSSLPLANGRLIKVIVWGPYIPPNCPPGHTTGRHTAFVWSSVPLPSPQSNTHTHRHTLCVINWPADSFILLPLYPCCVDSTATPSHSHFHTQPPTVYYNVWS